MYPFLHSVDDTRMRLDNTIIRDGKVPVYVERIGYDFEATLKRLDNGLMYGTKDIRDERFDFSPINLGYVNWAGDQCSYTYRKPARRWKQGLNVGHIVGLEGHRAVSRAMHKMIKGRYPSYEEAVNSDHYGVAFSRNWAVFGTELVYKGIIVGNDLELSENYTFLAEELEEARG